MFIMRPVFIGGGGSRMFFESPDCLLHAKMFCHKVSGIEVFLREPESVSSLLGSSLACDSVRKFSEVSIHAPFFNIAYGDDDETEKMLSDLREVYRSLGAKRIVFHPADVPDFSILSGRGMNVLIENMDFRKDRFQTWQEFRNILDAHDFGLCLDVAHAESISSSNLSGFVSELSDRIGELHVSHLVGGVHMPLHVLKGDRMENFKFLSGIEKPLVIENGDRDMGLIEKEVEFLKEF